MTEATIDRTNETLRERVIAAAEAAITEVTETPLPQDVLDDGNDVSRRAAASLMTVVFLVEQTASDLLAAGQADTNAGFAVSVLLDAIERIKFVATLSRAARG